MRYDPRWDDLGRGIQDAVDWAIGSRNYQQLNQTIRQVLDTAMDVGGEAIRKAQDTAQNASRSVAIRKLYGTTAMRRSGAVLKTVFGSLLLGVGGLATLGGILTAGFIWALPAFAVAAGTAVGGGVLLYKGTRTLTLLKRFQTYKRVLGLKTQCALEKLARAVGKDIPFVRQDVQKMIGAGFFLEGHLDHEQTCLITSDETYQQFEQARLQLEQARRQQAAESANAPDSRIKEVLDRGSVFIAQIRKCNDDIPGEEVSAKIDRIELVVRRIFERAKACPEVIPDLKKLMDYYLPMTVKLLNAYAEMDAQPVQSERIAASKREIEQTLDTLNLAFEKMLDDLFSDTILDISSDITVLNTMLAREGLTEDELTKMRKQQTFES